ncbi:MAG: acyl-CoA thioesterase/bile acid-CoA:amino acid N-acyltransferase family protein [Myxococcota bacterium]
MVRLDVLVISGLVFLAGCDSEVEGPLEPTSDASVDASVEGSVPEPDAMPAMPAIVVWDGERAVSEQRYGEPFSLRVTGLEPLQIAVLRARFWGYEGWAELQADEMGRIDTESTPSRDGTYEGIAADGLLWSMELQTPERGDSFDVDFDLEVDGEVVTSYRLNRTPIDVGLVSEPVSEPGLVGTLFYPESSEPLGGILVLGGSEGGLETASFRAATIAGDGYAALALAYFGAPGLPAELLEIPVEYFGQALEWMMRHPAIDPDRLAVFGASRGGELALMLGSRYGEIDAVIAEVPSGLRWGGGVSAGSGWSADGVPLAFVRTPPTASPSLERLRDGSTGYRFSTMFEQALALATPTEIAAATIPVEQTSGAVLMLGGADDDLWPSCELAQVAADRLAAEAGREDRFVCYADTGHFIGSPGWPTTEAFVSTLQDGTRVSMGGTAEGTARAQRAAREEILEFLGRHL